MVSVRCRRTLPSPRQSGQGSFTRSPVPSHSGQGRDMAKKPCRNWSCPWPRQVAQVVAPAPPFPPRPLQVSQVSWRESGTETSVPNAAFSKVSRTSARRSSPCRRRPRATVPPPPKPKKSPRMSAKSTKLVGSNRGPPGAAERVGAETVVLRSLLGIREDRVRFGRFPEALRGLVVPRIPVRVVLQGRLAVGRLDGLVRRVARNAEDLVEVTHGVSHGRAILAATPRAGRPAIRRPGSRACRAWPA